MTCRVIRFSMALGTFASLIIIASGIMLALGFRINASPSIPIGLYKLTDHKTYKRGNIVILCPPKSDIFIAARDNGYFSSGFCPGYFEPLFKPVAAIEGDLIAISDSGISVNGKPIKNSRRFQMDGHKNPLPRPGPGEFRVAANTIWLVSDYSARSFDSRYFGPIATRHIQGSIQPVLLISEPK